MENTVSTGFTGVKFVNEKFEAYLNDTLVCRTVSESHAYRQLRKAQDANQADAQERQRVQTQRHAIKRMAATVATFTMPEGGVRFVPERDPYYVPFGHFKTVQRVIESGAFYPIYITGLSGNGKSMMVEQVCAKLGREFIRLQINEKTDEDQLIGSRTLVNGNVEIVEGPVLMAMRRGAVLALDEVDLGDPNEIMCLQGILEGKPYFFKLKNEIVYPQPGFNIVATANTKGRGSDSGQFITNFLSEAFLERFPITIEQEYPPMATELRIIKNEMERYDCGDEAFADTLAKWSDTIRRTFMDGGLDSMITTRRLRQIVEGFSIFRNKRMAIELACNRFDSLTKKAFIDVYDKMTPEEPKAEEGAAEPAADTNNEQE